MMAVPDEGIVAEMPEMPRGAYNKFVNGRTSIENYKLVISYMHDNKVTFSRAIYELELDKIRANLYRIRADIINGKLQGKHLEEHEREELRRATEWMVNFNPSIKAQLPAKKKKAKKKIKPLVAKEEPVAPVPVPKEKKPERSRKIVCLVGDARDIAASLSEILKGG